MRSVPARVVVADQADGSGRKPAVDAKPFVTVRRPFRTRCAIGHGLSADCLADEHVCPLFDQIFADGPHGLVFPERCGCHQKHAEDAG